MQNVSKAFKKSIRNPRALRNRGYIKVYIGVINQKAQDAVSAEDSRNDFTDFTDLRKPFEGYEDFKLYATGEEDFSKVDGSMYFLPEEKALMTYNNGLVTEKLLGEIYISFGGVTGLDIKGLTINFGECYPVDFTVESNNGIHSYDGNTKSEWRTEEVFLNTSYFIIKPTKMVNGQGRFRILQFFCGIVNIFSNTSTIDYSFKDYISPISESIPSQDMTLTVDNQNLYYDPDNDNSALAFMEIGQEIRISFGYDVDGRDNIEWLKPNTCYLKTWKADDETAKFTATDRFDLIDTKYDRGLFRAQGITLYDLAVDVLKTAGITDSREYYIDPYLKKIVVNNPMPVVKCTEALQIIANAGRCILYQDREARICLKSSFIPEMSVETPDKVSFSNVDKLLKDDRKPAYAMASHDFSVVDGSIFFCPEGEPFLHIGYVSSIVADGHGLFSVNPKITINMEAAFMCFGMEIHFRNVAPRKFVIYTYNEGASVQKLEVSDPDLNYITYEQFDLFDKMVIEVTEGYPFARVTIDNILIGDVTDYYISNDVFHATPERSRQEKIGKISVVRSLYRESFEKKELSHGEVLLDASDPELTLNFSHPSYGYEVSVLESEIVTCKITESSSYFVKLHFDGLTGNETIAYSVSGYEYAMETSKYIVSHGNNGSEKEWNNPLISTVEHAKKIEEWIAEYFLGNVDYKLNWWSDPCVDANDLFYLEMKDRDPTLIRAYQNEIKFSGAWSGTIKARKAVVMRGG